MPSVPARSYIADKGLQNSTSGSVHFLCFHFTVTLWKFVPGIFPFSESEFFHSPSRNFTGEHFQTDCPAAAGRTSKLSERSGIVTGFLCILLADLRGKNLERVILGHKAVLNQQRTWILGEI